MLPIKRLARGVMYIAYGANAIREARYSHQSLNLKNAGLPACVLSDRKLDFAMPYISPRRDPGARSQKVNLDWMSPYDVTCYLDADTRVHGDLSEGFAVCEDGWDMAIVPSAKQGVEFLWHISPEEREHTMTAIGLGQAAVQLGGGVFFFRKSPAITALFLAWREEWNVYRDQDQAALLRALFRSPVRVWMLGEEWNRNGGLIVNHYFGRARSA